MLWGIQFPHARNRTSSKFKIYPLRVIFNLMNDIRLNKKIYTDEIIFILIFIENISNRNDYDSLVSQILDYRKLSDEHKISLFNESEVGSQDNINKCGFEHATSMFWANKTHEWQYYILELIGQSGLIKCNIGEEIVKFKHYLIGAKTKTTRSLRKNYYEINSDVKEYFEKLNTSQTLFDPIQKRDEYSSEEEFTMSYFSYLPQVLLDELNEKSIAFNFLRENEDDLRVNVNEIIEFSESSNNWLGFEEVSTKAFNTFSDIKAMHVGGAGKTDIECFYKKNNSKFNVDTKTRGHQLISVPTVRLKNHRENGALFTLIITSRYSIGALGDIKGTKNTILQAKMFANYIFKSINNDNIDFEYFYNLMSNNLGTSITRKLYNHILDKYGIEEIKFS